MYVGEFHLDDMPVIDNICALLPEGKGRILEAGCGMGHFGKKLVSKGYTCIGVDLSSQVVKRLTENTKNLNGYTVLKGDLEDIGLFESGTFDLILAPTVLHHFPNLTSSKIISNFFYWLSDNGICVIYEPNGTNIINKISGFLGEVTSKFYKYEAKTPNEKNHSFFDYSKVFSREGFLYEGGLALTPSTPPDDRPKKTVKYYLLRFLLNTRTLLYRLTYKILPFPWGGGTLLLTFRKSYMAKQRRNK